MKRYFTLIMSIIAFWGNAMAQDKTTMLEVHDFTGFANQNQGTSIAWGEQTGDDLNSSWDKVTLLSITGNVNGVSTTRNYYSWIEQNHSLLIDWMLAIRSPLSTERSRHFAC